MRLAFDESPKYDPMSMASRSAGHAVSSTRPVPAARTTAGAGVLNGLQVLSGSLQTQPTDQLPKGREYEQLSRILPYAVVLGGADRWLQAIALADTDADSDGADLSWYSAGPDWHLSDLPDSVRNFVTTVQGTLFSR